MNEAIGQSLPIAVGVMVSPLPIVAVVLMLVSGRTNAITFLFAWVVAVGGVTMLIGLVASTGSADGAAPAAWTGWVRIVLGLLLLAVAARQWHGRPRGEAEPSTPAWMAAVDTFTPVKAGGLAVLLGVVNPKNLLLVLAGGTAIATSASDDTGTIVGAAVVFAVVASLGVAAPVVIYLAAADRAEQILDDLRRWLVGHNAVIMAVLLLVLGAKLLGDGLAVL